MGGITEIFLVTESRVIPVLRAHRFIFNNGHFWQYFLVRPIMAILRGDTFYSVKSSYISETRLIDDMEVRDVRTSVSGV